MTWHQIAIGEPVRYAAAGLVATLGAVYVALVIVAAVLTVVLSSPGKQRRTTWRRN